jgi:antitoxin (DNA-binding transcriptional repressor) of toxin-antitoxin stability system
MPTIFALDTKNQLAELIHALNPGEEIIITENNQPIARLQVTLARGHQPRQPGTLKGTVQYMAPDFNAPLDDFQEYMQ